MALPFLHVYCGVKGRSDLYEHELKKKARIDPSSI
jgi:hypothetical protein